MLSRCGRPSSRWGLLLLLGAAVFYWRRRGCHHTATTLSAGDRSPSPWRWRCESGDGAPRCVRVLVQGAPTKGLTSLQTCHLTCGQWGGLWPRPRAAQLGNSVSFFHPSSVDIFLSNSGAERHLLAAARDRFMEDLYKHHPDYEKGMEWSTEAVPCHHIKIVIDVSSESKTRLSFNNSDEKYSLSISTLESVTNVKIVAKTFFGARHALETLQQLIDYEEVIDTLQVVNFAEISDEPSFPYRGLLLDTSRNFYSVKSIKRTLDAMAVNKLNTFHWHITDSHSFPVVLQSVPDMAHYGAYSPKQVYLAEDIRAVVDYALVRGIRVLPELDAPAHVGNGWQWGAQRGLGDLAVCVNKAPWQDFCLQAPCGQLNIANKNMYSVLGKIYKEFIELFGPVDLFHFGGDEVNLNCWNTTEEIVTWMKKKHGGDLSADAYYREWSNFQIKAYQLLTQANGGTEIQGVIWTSHLTEKNRTKGHLDKSKYIIQVWSKGSDPLIKEVLEAGFNVIFSNSDAWYLDCGFSSPVGAGHNWCSPYKGWQTVYDNSPASIALHQTGHSGHRHQLLGGEGTMWSEQVDQHNMESRIWPRAAALAERLWSDPETGWREAEARMLHHRHRLVKRGVQADRLQPEWCWQNEGQCPLTDDTLVQIPP